MEIRELKMGNGDWAIETVCACASFFLDVLQLCFMGAGWSGLGLRLAAVLTGKAVLFVVGIWTRLVVDWLTSHNMRVEWIACSLLKCQRVNRANVRAHV